MSGETIWKFPLEITDQQVIGQAPEITRALSVGLDADGTLCLWCEVSPGRIRPSTPTRDVKVSVVGTGNPMPFWAGDFVGSVTMPPFVWHVYVNGIRDLWDGDPGDDR